MEMVKQLRKGDVLYVKSKNWFGRDCDEIGNQWCLLAKEMGGDNMIQDMPISTHYTKREGVGGSGMPFRFA